MKNKIFKNHVSVFVLILACWTETMQAQPLITGNKAKQLIEKTVLFTDREMYVVDENILFSAFNVSSPGIRNAEWSNILYIELISPDGEALTRGKYVFSQKGTTGTLKIPTNVLTGNYYLKAYTRWMRDYSPYNYFYKMVTVINPFRSELLEPSNNAGIKTEMESPPFKSTDFRVKTNKDSYKKRDSVFLEVSSTELNDDVKSVISVIPKGLENLVTPRKTTVQKQDFLPDFIPETRGLSISGKIVNQLDSVPIPFTLVGLTIFKENPENQNVLTNANGQFYFDLSRLKGEYEIFISAKSTEQQMPLILVDNDYSTSKIELPYVPVNLSVASKNIYQSLIFNSQIHTLYTQQKTEDELKSFSSDSSFYGKPDFVLKMSNYIAMPSVKDYFYELIPQLGVRHEGKKTRLKVLGVYSDLAIYDPLVLVDMVPIFDIDKVLELQPDKIDRIEVVSTPYVRGDICFGGVVSLFSKKGDLAGIDLPTVGRFITYNMLSRDIKQVSTDSKNQHIPDLRNCLYWNADLKLDERGSTKISFNTGDNVGDYIILIRSTDQLGQSKFTTHEFTVK